MQGAEFSGTERFQLIRRLGAGGMGVVFEVFDRERECRLALKTLQRMAADDIYRLKREFRTLAGIGHPNLVGLHDLVVDGDLCFFTMELVIGRDLLSYCRIDDRRRRPSAATTRMVPPDARLGNDGEDTTKSPQLPVFDAPIVTRPAAAVCDPTLLRASMWQLADGLRALHQANTIHRDVKPSNVLVTNAGRVVLLDFGLAADAARASKDSLLGHVVGTIQYMSPEQAGLQIAPTAASDWYSVGVILYEALCGRLPFSGGTPAVLAAKLNATPRPPSAWHAGVPEDLDALCMRLLDRDPERRPSGNEVLSALATQQATRTRRTAPTATARDTFDIPFTGRTRELAMLNELFERIDRRESVVVFVHGPSGIGKTQLVRQFVTAVSEQTVDVAVLTGRCFERETVSYKGIDSLIDDLSRLWVTLSDRDAAAMLPRAGGLLPKLFPVLGRVPVVARASMPTAMSDPHDQKSRAVAALREVFQRLADRRRLIVFLDDMQWIDADTLALLADLMRPPDPPSLMLVLASHSVDEERARDEGSWSDALSSFDGAILERVLALEVATSAPRLDLVLKALGVPVTDIALGPLDDDDALAIGRGGSLDLDDTLVAEIAVESGGNPLYLTELVRYAHTVAPEHVTSIRLETVLDHRIRRLPDAARSLLEVIATAGHPIARRVAGTACNLEGGELSQAERTLQLAQMIRVVGGRVEDCLEPYHDHVRRAALAPLTADQRARHHRALAVSLIRWQDATPERLARHCLAAGDNARAAEHALRAAREAAETLDFERAAGLYELALTIGGYGNEERLGLLVALGDARAIAGRPGEAAETFLAAAALATQLQRVELRNRAAEQLLRGGYLERGQAEIRGVLTELGLSVPMSPRGAIITLLAHRAALRLRGLRYRKRDESDVPRRALTAADAYAVAGMGLALVDPMAALSYQTRFFRRALRLGEPRRVVRAMAFEASFLAAVGNGRARHLADRARALADGMDSQSLAFAEWAIGAVSYFLDNAWAKTFDTMTLSGRLFRDFGQVAGWEIDTIQLYTCFSLLYLGELGKLLHRVPVHIRKATRRGDRFGAVSLRTRLNILWLVRDDPDAAAADLDDAIGSWPPPRPRPYVQHFYAALSRGELALYRGATSDAVDRLREDLVHLNRAHLLRVSIVRVETDYLLGRLLLATARTRNTAEALAEVRGLVRRLQRESMPMARAAAILLAAGCAELEGDRSRVLDLLRTAVGQLEQTETNLYARAATRRIGELVGGIEGKAIVGEADQWLAAQGVENPSRMTAMLVPTDDAGDR